MLKLNTQMLLALEKNVDEIIDNSKIEYQVSGENVMLCIITTDVYTKPFIGLDDSIYSIDNVEEAEKSAFIKAKSKLREAEWQFLNRLNNYAGEYDHLFYNEKEKVEDQKQETLKNAKETLNEILKIFKDFKFEPINPNEDLIVSVNIKYND